MKQVLIKKGQVVVEEVPAPIVGADEVLVQVCYSCVSAGTEVSALKTSGMPLHKKALRQPEKIKKALRMLKAEGLSKMVGLVKGGLGASHPTGYSASGIVLEAGSGIKDIKQGDRVACAGAGIANHAEFIAVPRNLLVKVPEDLSLDTASTVTLGSIAMQGVRRADPKLGESVAVVGLGILGQLTVQMLKADGCRVVGIDVDQRRVDIAVSSGMDRGLNPARDKVVDEVIRFSSGYGVDSVIITASAKSSEIVNQAMEMCRRKGKVVIVGAGGRDLKREEFYRKELDVLISTSYGPGRYDETYEHRGVDYPYAYVRWTENRNMDGYLRLLKDRKMDIGPLIEKVCPVEEAARVYEDLKAGGSKPLVVLLEYSKESIPEKKIVISTKKIKKDVLNVGLIGTGAFSKGMHLPNLRRLKNIYSVYAIADRTGSNAEAVARQYGAAYATADHKDILGDKNVDVVFITTRHDLHARMAIEAAKMGKAVFLEKPMALNKEELDELVRVLEETKVPFMVGFNRRFSPYAKRIKEIVKNRINPLIISYRVNAGFIPKDHWVHLEEGGGRNIGEACHIYDLFNFFTESEVKSIAAHSIDPKTDQYGKSDNFVVSIKYQEGSVCNLIYTALGAKEDSKEQMEIYVDGKIIRLDDYRKLEIFGTRTRGMNTGRREKGHYEELLEFAKAIKEGRGYPIALWQLVQATEISFEVDNEFL